MSDDWQPPPGMMKRKCCECQRFFATARRVSICPSCSVGSLRPSARGSASPFAPAESTGSQAVIRVDPSEKRRE